MKTNMGDITLELFADKAPKTVANFITLAQKDFYDGILFHRVIPEFMIQTGDPNTKTDPKKWETHGMGGPGYTFNDEINDIPLVQGSLGMAHAGKNTNGSQFFIVTAQATPWLDGEHTNFGRVVAGMDVALEIENVETNSKDHPLKDVIIEDIEIQK
ncbi:peptidylprolyl isomerase [Candidatus Falkowbacteria bacterium]|nr:peptidylprolyl isomerase [Candidatus Falkowbacteria bacterium]